MREFPECPVCHEECQKYFVSYYGNEIVGCENCIFTEDAFERAGKDEEDARIDYEYEREE